VSHQVRQFPEPRQERLAGRESTHALSQMDDMWLREKGRETVENVQLLCALASVFRAGRTPTAKERSLTIKFGDVLDDTRHRNPFAANAANQRVVNIDVDGKLRKS
jgi:hypothetical protein